MLLFIVQIKCQGTIPSWLTVVWATEVRKMLPEPLSPEWTDMNMSYSDCGPAQKQKWMMLENIQTPVAISDEISAMETIISLTCTHNLGKLICFMLKCACNKPAKMAVMESHRDRGSQWIICKKRRERMLSCRTNSTHSSTFITFDQHYHVFSPVAPPDSLLPT